MKRAPCLLLASMLLLPAPPLFAAGGTAKGTMTVNGRKFDLAFAYATPKKNPFDKSKTDTLVILSDRPIPEKAVYDEFEMMRVADDLQWTGVALQVTGDMSVVSGMFYSPAFEKMTSFSATGMHKVEAKAWAKDRVSGRAYMEAENEFFGNTYQYDATFDAPVIVDPGEGPLPGKPLPAGGGEPGKAYEKYRKALFAGDLETLRTLVSAERAADMDKPEFKEMFPLIQEMMPKNIRITGGAIDGDKATLKVDASTKEEKSTGTITMVREGGQWKVQKESWSSRME